MGQQGFWDWKERHEKLSSKKPLPNRGKYCPYDRGLWD